MPRSLDYYFSLLSPWAYIGHASFMDIARRHGVTVNYKPVALAQVFTDTGGLPLAKRHRVRLIFPRRSFSPPPRPMPRRSDTKPMCATPLRPMPSGRPAMCSTARYFGGRIASSYSMTRWPPGDRLIARTLEFASFHEKGAA